MLLRMEVNTILAAQVQRSRNQRVDGRRAAIEAAVAFAYRCNHGEEP